MQGINATRVQTEVLTYTLHIVPPPLFIATIGAIASGATNASLVTTIEIKVDPLARYSGTHIPGVQMWLK